MKPTFQYSAIITDIHDGDTITVSVDCGFRIRYSTPIRLYGINAPELKTAEGKAALAYLQTLIIVGDPITITTFKDPHEKYGRWLAKVVNKNGLDINQAMVDSGHAIVYLS